MPTGRRFKFLVNRVRPTPTRKTSFRSNPAPASNIAPPSPANPFDLCSNHTQHEIIAAVLRTPSDWTRISRHDILDPRTRAAITPGALDQAIRRLSLLGLLEVRGSGDLLEVKLIERSIDSTITSSLS